MFFCHLSIPRDWQAERELGKERERLDGVFDNHMSANHLFMNWELSPV